MYRYHFLWSIVLLGKLIVSQLVENLAVHCHTYENLPLASAKSISKILCAFISTMVGVYSVPIFYLVKVQIIMLTVTYFFPVYCPQHFVLKPCQ